MTDTILWIFVYAPALTILVEFPIVYFTKTCKKPIYIIATNGLTNLTLNLTSLLLGILGGWQARLLWILFAELLLIPNAEAQLYRRISPRKTGCIYLFTYLANAASYLAGALFNFLLTGHFSLLPV